MLYCKIVLTYALAVLASTTEFGRLFQIFTIRVEKNA